MVGEPRRALRRRTRRHHRQPQRLAVQPPTQYEGVGVTTDTELRCDVGDLDAFIRTYMLDRPQTYARAERLVENFTQLDEAYRAAAAAQEEWAATPPKDRAAVLRRAAEILEERRDEVIDWLVKEAGSTRIKADSEVSLAIAITQEAASFPTRVHGKIFDSNTPNRETRVYRKPVGVVVEHVGDEPLHRAGLEPGFLVGGVPLNFGTSARLGALGAPFVIEADEYDTAFFDKRKPRWQV